MEADARAEGLEPIDRAAQLAAWRESGWPGEPDPIHVLLFRHWTAEARLGGAFVYSSCGPRVRWPYGTQLLAQHLEEIARFARAIEDQHEAERRNRRAAE